MKYVVLSFDDGRKDFYQYALPILKKYNLTATLNVIADYIGREDLPNFATAGHACMNRSEILESKKWGIEIANHATDHSNRVEAILDGQEKLNYLLGREECLGFASPASYICRENFSTYQSLCTKKRIAYLRSGNQIRRDGKFYMLLYLLYRLTKFSRLFYWYNLRNYIDLDKKEYIQEIFPSVTCSIETAKKDIVSLINNMKDNHALILMFHSILPKTSPNWLADKWCNSTDDFEDICSFLANDADIRVVTNMQLNDIMQDYAQ